MKNIFVGNLDFNATEEAVRSLFERYGAVNSARIMTDRDTGVPAGSRSWKWRMNRKRIKRFKRSMAIPWTAARSMSMKLVPSRTVDSAAAVAAATVSAAAVAAAGPVVAEVAVAGDPAVVAAGRRREPRW